MEGIAALREAHADDAEFGYCLLADEARQLGFPMADRTAWRLCNQSGIMSAIVETQKRRGKKPGPPVCDDLVQRDFTTTAANQLWLVDITKHDTREGKIYLCAVKDVFSRRNVGYSIADRVKATRPDPTVVKYPDLVRRDCSATVLSRLWVTDSTLVPTWARVAYACLNIDAYSGTIVGWRIASNYSKQSRQRGGLVANTYPDYGFTRMQVAN